MSKVPATDDPVAAVREAEQSPGARLRSARDARKLTLAQASDELHIPMPMLEALERDDYARLPTPVFVRGYLRNYARLVGLDPEPILAGYAQRSGTETPPLQVRPPLKKQSHSGDWQVRWITYSIVAVLVVLLFMWWRNQTDFQFGSAPEPVAEAPAVAPPELATADETAALALPELDAQAPVYTPPAETAPETPALPDAAAIEAAAPTAASGAQPADIAPPQAAPAAAVTAAPLTLRFGEDCWTEVRDATGQRVLYDLVEAGTTRAIEGTPPFKVLLGNAPAVEVEFNGQPFDTTPYRNGRIARFTVGG